MKKAFPLRKGLSATLAAALAVACFAGTAPATAAGGSYAYSSIGNYGTFEDYMWYLVNNTSEDTLKFNAENQPVVTKGAKSNGSEFTSLGSRRAELAAGKYQLSFSIKSSSRANYILEGYGFNSAGDAKALSYEGATESAVGTEWTAVTASFEVTEGFTSNEFRIILRGNAGTQITVKDLDVRAITEEVKTRSVATLDGWNHIDDNSVLSYNNPNLDDCKIIAEDIGYNGNGAAHFYKHGSGGTELHLSQKLDNAIMSAYDDNTIFVFEADVKNVPVNSEAMFVSLEGSMCSWQEGDAKIYYLNSGATYDWTHITRKIKKEAAGDFYMTIRTGGYYVGDFYIDNIKMYAENDESKANILSNSDFYKKEPVTTLDGWTGSYFGNLDLAYNNPNTATCKIEVVNDGADDSGSVHFYRENTDADGRPTARILYQISNAKLVGYDIGTEFVLEAKTKGKSPSPANDSMKFTLENSPYSWTDGSALAYNYELNSNEWVTFTKEFKKDAAGDLFIIIRSGGYTAADFYIDNIKVYVKGDESKTNLISNGDFCETESVVSDTSAIDNSAYRVQNVPGFDIGMLNDTLEGNKDISVVPGGSYDGSAAVRIGASGDSAADKKERYFQQLNGVKFVLGDTAVKATGYFKVTSGNTEPKIWLGFGKEYSGKSSVGLHFADYLKSGKADSGESFSEQENGWYYFEKTVDTSSFGNQIKNMSELVFVKYMCGIDARENRGSALFDNVTCEIISSAAPGDTNGDDSIDIRDLVHMKKYAAGTVGFTEMTRGTWLSDIGYSENPSITNEMVSMRKYLIGAISEYGK